MMKSWLSHLIMISAIVGSFLISTSAAYAACRGQITSGTHISGKTAYDPFNPLGVTDNYRITIANTGTETCNYELIFRSKGSEPMLGGKLTYTLTDTSGAPLFTNVPVEMAPAVRTKTAIAPGASAQIEFLVKIARGQFAAPAMLEDTPHIELYALDENGRPVASLLQEALLQINYNVDRVFSVNVKGTSASIATVHFGTLTKGAMRTVEIQARSNLTYQLDVASDNHGALVLTPKVAGQDWRVGYTATLGGQALDLRDGTSLHDLQPTMPGVDASYPLTVTIGDVAQKRAGRYEDVITITINSVRP
jgi:hypothetical protein